MTEALPAVLLAEADVQARVEALAAKIAPHVDDTDIGRRTFAFGCVQAHSW